MTIRIAMLLLCSSVLMGACATQSPAQRSAGEATSPQRNETVPVTGGTGGAGMIGTTNGSSPSGPLEGERASTPPGKDQAGDHPSSGAIVDPTGAATQEPVKY